LSTRPRTEASRIETTTIFDGDLSGCVVSGRYELGGLLGAGGMAEVYLARDVRLDRSVAVKLFQGGATPEDQIRLDREAQVLAGLRCPGVVRVYDTGSHRGRPFYVMQAIDGGTLRQRMRGALPPALVARVGAQVADTLTVVHAAGVVHRDIKPSNILLDDEEHQAYLADFGLALQAHATRVTRSGMLVGTAGYLAPEQLRGAEVAPAADVYALGLVLLECLTGRPEYPGGDTEAALARLSRTPRIPAGLPAPWAELLVAMTHSDPTRRPTAADCGDRLRAAQAASAGVPPLVDLQVAYDDEPTTSTPLVVPAPRRVAVVLGGAAAAAVVAVAIGIATLNSPKTDLPAAPTGTSTVPTTVEQVKGPPVDVPPATVTVPVTVVPEPPVDEQPQQTTVPVEKTKKPKKDKGGG
jgi:serine/threonine protein kinase